MVKAYWLFQKDVNYVIKDGQVVIVDEFTGRMMPGRRWSDGLHQAIEAKEGVKIAEEYQTLATITFQNYFRMYRKIAGMTGTADTEAPEFQKIYKLEVAVIPTNKPMIRHWCEAMEDGNPVYTDEKYARTTKYGGIIAPPQMAQAYCIPVLWPKKELPPDPLAKSCNMMDKAGYFGVVATTTTHEYFKPMKPGDRLNYTIKLIKVSDEKTTRMGTGCFITAEYTYKNQDGEVVCKQPFTVMKFKPTGS